MTEIALFLGQPFRCRPDLPIRHLCDYSLDLARQLAKAWAAGMFWLWGRDRAENITAFVPLARCSGITLLAGMRPRAAPALPMLGMP